MAPATIRESFKQTLPNLPQDGTAKVATMSGQSTSLTDPPCLFVARAIDAYSASADDALKDGKVRTQTENAYLPAIEQTFYLFTEGDVVRAAALYLLHPVNVALAAIFPRRSIYCSAELASNGTRPDVVYMDGNTLVAVLEFKNTGIIVPAQFEVAGLRGTSTMEDINRKCDTRSGNTFFEDNSWVLLKQMANYRNNRQTDYIAIFDWNHLFIAVFTPQSENFVHGTFVHREGNGERYLRRALLGWLIEAFQNTGKCSFALPSSGTGGGGSSKSVGGSSKHHHSKK